MEFSDKHDPHLPTSYRYKRLSGRKKPVKIEGPAVITTALKRRRASDEAKAALAASVKLAPDELERQPVIKVAPSDLEQKPAVGTIRDGKRTVKAATGSVAE